MPTYGPYNLSDRVTTWESPAYAAGGGSHLAIGYWGGYHMRAAMRFAEPAGWDAWTSITKATLTFFISDHDHVGVRNSSIWVRRCTMAGGIWTKAAGTQSCESGYSASNTTQYDDLKPTSTEQVAFSSGTTANAQKSVDVTAHVRYYWGNRASLSVLPFIFDPNTTSDYTELWHKAGYYATLTIDYESNTPPVAPTLVAPAAGTTTADDTPTLSWTHSDPQGDPQASANVQLWDAAGTTLLATYNVVGTGSTYTIPARPRGLAYQWCVQTADAEGYGPYSAKRTFTIRALPVTTITNTRFMEYASGAARLRVKWTCSQTQTHYRVQTASPAFDSGWIAGTVQEYLLSTVNLTSGTAVSVTVSVRTDPFPLEDSDNRSFTPRHGITVHRRDLTVAPVNWGTPVIVSTVPAGASIVVEYGSSATATATPSPNTWYSSLSAVPKARYVFYRATLIPSASAGPSLDSITIKSDATTQVVDKWSVVRDTPGLSAPWSIDTGEYVYGSRSIRADVTGAGPWVCSSYGIPVRAGRSYILTGLMKSEGNSGCLFRVIDLANNVLATSPSLTATTDWFTADGRDVNRYRTPVFVAPADMTVWVALRVGGTAGSQAWFDAIKLEESTVATPWSPGALGATVIDAGGVQVDAAKGGIFRLRGSANGVRDVVELGANGLDFGGDTKLASPSAGALDMSAPTGAAGYLQVVAVAGQRAGLVAKIAGEANARTVLWGDATLQGLELGPGTAVRDTNLYRSAANQLKTDDALQVVGLLTGAAANFTGALDSAASVDGATGLFENGVRLLQPAGLRIHRGTASVVLTTVNTATLAVAFSPVFSSAPIVIVSLAAGSATMIASCESITASGFTARASRKDEATTSGTFAVTWIAIGPA